MSADYYNGRVSLNMDFDSARKTFTDKVSKFWFHIAITLIFTLMTSWLIVLTLNSTSTQKLKEENKSLREIIELNQKTIEANTRKIETIEANQKTQREKLESFKIEKANKDELSNLSEELSKFKSGYKEKQEKIHFSSKTIVHNHFNPRHGKDVTDDLNQLRTDFFLHLSTNIYEKIDDHGYFFKLKSGMNYTNAKDACSKLGGHIVQFDETEENVQEFFKSLHSHFHYHGALSFFVGLTDEETEGSFKWERSGLYYSKMPNAMSLWSRGEPNNVGSEHCVIGKYSSLDYYSSLRLYDVKCSEKHTIICEKW